VWKTGLKDITQLGNYSRFNGSENLSFQWDFVHHVAGTGGDSFAPGEATSIAVFAEELARIFYFNLNSTDDFLGIHLNRYTLEQLQFDIDPTWDEYSVRGFINLTKQQGSPLFLCLPHFLHSPDDWVAGKIEGMAEATIDRDETFLDVEPLTGTTMHAHKRLQFNFYIPPKKDGNWLNTVNAKIPKAQFYPLMHLDEHAEITPALADQFKDQVYGTKQLGQILTIALTAGGSVIFVVSMLALIYEMKKRQEVAMMDVLDPSEQERLISPA